MKVGYLIQFLQNLYFHNLNPLHFLHFPSSSVSFSSNCSFSLISSILVSCFAFLFSSLLGVLNIFLIAEVLGLFFLDPLPINSFIPFTLKPFKQADLLIF